MYVSFLKFKLILATCYISKTTPVNSLFPGIIVRFYSILFLLSKACLGFAFLQCSLKPFMVHINTLPLWTMVQ